MAETIDIRRADTRFHTRAGWLGSHHSFSFGRHYDPADTGHGLLLVSNDDVIAPHTGFETHPHRDMEIVTWVLSGRLEHTDTLGNRGEIHPGLAQRMTAGRGIWHSEKNPDADQPVHLVQMWVPPDTDSLDPGYQQLDINTELDRGGLVPIASGRGDAAAITIGQRDAVLWGGRLQPGETVTLPEGRCGYLFVALGAVDLAGGDRLVAGDAVRLTDVGALTLTAGPDGAELLFWQMG